LDARKDTQSVKTHSTNPERSVTGTGLRRNQLTQLYVEKRPLNGSSDGNQGW